MDMAPKKNTKWVIIGSIILVLAILVAVGPVLIIKYMRAKWESNNHYQTSALLMNVAGELQKSDNNYYIKGDNGLYYVLEEINQDISDNLNEKCSVIGKFREAKNNETINGNPVRLFIGVQKIVFKDSNKVIDNNVKITETIKKDVDVKAKSLAKAKLRVEANTRLSKPIFFDVIKGNVFFSNRKDLNGKEYVAIIVVDEFGDNYMLYKKGADLSSLENKEIICLGREIMTPNNLPLVVNEVTFEIYEVYDTEYNKLM